MILHKTHNSVYVRLNRNSNFKLIGLITWSVQVIKLYRIACMWILYYIKLFWFVSNRLRKKEVLFLIKFYRVTISIILFLVEPVWSHSNLIDVWLLFKSSLIIRVKLTISTTNVVLLVEENGSRSLLLGSKHNYWSLPLSVQRPKGWSWHFLFEVYKK